MWLLSWLSLRPLRCHHRRPARRPARAARGRPACGPLEVESLEDRTVPSFLAPIGTPGISNVVVGDFNGDGRADVVSVDYASNGVSVRLGNGDGTFGAPETFATDAYPRSAVVGDFNGDGKLDLATINGINPSLMTINVLLGNGDGTFQPRTTSTLAGGQNYGPPAVGDMNGDGKLDLVITRWSIAGRYHTLVAYTDVYLGRADGSLKLTSSTPLVSTGNWLALGDFNQDHKLDVLTSDGSAEYLQRGTGKGTLQPATRVAQVAGGPLAVGDFNGDGKLDFATITNNTVSVALGNGRGAFGIPQTFAVGVSPASLVVGDFNHDGKLDMVTANKGSGDITVLLGNGDGSFKTALSIAAGPVPFTLAAGDFNGDGWLDLVVTNYDSASQAYSIAVLLNDRRG
jgi:hypothetical protein